MIDIHCHILPRFDDGASSLEESLIMARMAADSGVTDIVATPHFPGSTDTLDQLPRLMERYETLSRAIRRMEIPLTLHLGAEVLCLAETVELAASKQLPTIGSTPYFLTEFYFDESLSYMNEMLEELSDAGYTPVVAHPERYYAIQHNPTILRQWFRQGYVLQLNKGSVLGAFGPQVRHTAGVILDEGLAHVIASDAHSARHRTPHMGRLTDWVRENVADDYARILLEENPRRLIHGEAMVPAE